jgi:hypothetical protein
MESVLWQIGHSETERAGVELTPASVANAGSNNADATPPAVAHGIIARVRNDGIILTSILCSARPSAKWAEYRHERIAATKVLGHHLFRKPVPTFRHPARI